MKYHIDYYSERMKCWKPTKFVCDDEKEAIKQLDKMFIFFKPQLALRVITTDQEVVAQRLLAKKI